MAYLSENDKLFLKLVRNALKFKNILANGFFLRLLLNANISLLNQTLYKRRFTKSSIDNLEIHKRQLSQLKQLKLLQLIQFCIVKTISPPFTSTKLLNCYHLTIFLRQFCNFLYNFWDFSNVSKIHALILIQHLFKICLWEGICQFKDIKLTKIKQNGFLLKNIFCPFLHNKFQRYFTKEKYKNMKNALQRRFEIHLSEKNRQNKKNIFGKKMKRIMFFSFCQRIKENSNAKSQKFNGPYKSITNRKDVINKFFPFNTKNDYPYNQYNQMFSIINGFNGIFAIVAVGMRAGSTVLQSQIKEVANKIKKEAEKYSSMLNASKTYQQTVKIITSPVLSVQKKKVDILLTSNLQNVEQYYKTLKSLMQTKQVDQFHSLMKDLPGSTQNVKNMGLKIGNHSLFGLNMILSIYGVYQTNQMFKKFKNSIMTPDVFTLGDTIDKPNSSTGMLISRSFDPHFLTYLPFYKFIAQASRLIHLKSYSALFIFFVRNLLRLQAVLNQKNTVIIQNIKTGAVFIASILEIGLALYSLSQSQQTLRQAKQKLEQLKQTLQQFYNQCLGILYNVKSFLADFQAQLFSFTSFLSYIQLVCTHNLLPETDTQQISQEIAKLQVGLINEETHKSVKMARQNLDMILQGLVIIQKQVFNKKQNKNKLVYTSNQNFERVNQRFSKVTAIITQLDQKIKIVDIYNAYYQKLQKAQLILKRLTFQKPQTLVNFALDVGKSINNNNELHIIQVLYQTAFDIDQLSDNDKYKIAKVISFSTDVFPKGSNNTKVYNYELSSFKMKLEQKYIVSRTTQIQDIDMSKIMGNWPQKMKNKSIQQILKRNNVTEVELRYIGSSIYIQNDGKASQPDWQLSRVQVFEKNKNYSRFYVFYDSITNSFQDVKIGPLKRLEDLAKK